VQHRPIKNKVYYLFINLGLVLCGLCFGENRISEIRDARRGSKGILTQAGEQDEEDDGQRSRTNDLQQPAVASGGATRLLLDDDESMMTGWLWLTFADGLVAVGTAH